MRSCNPYLAPASICSTARRRRCSIWPRPLPGKETGIEIQESPACARSGVEAGHNRQRMDARGLMQSPSVSHAGVTALQVAEYVAAVGTGDPVPAAAVERIQNAEESSPTSSSRWHGEPDQ
jgi:hypothetical protein